MNEIPVRIKCWRFSNFGIVNGERREVKPSFQILSSISRYVNDGNNIRESKFSSWEIVIGEILLPNEIMNYLEVRRILSSWRTIEYDVKYFVNNMKVTSSVLSNYDFSFTSLLLSIVNFSQYLEENKYPTPSPLIGLSN